MEEETKNEKTTDEGSEAEGPQTETTAAEGTNLETEDTKPEEVKAAETAAEDTGAEAIKAEETEAPQTEAKEEETGQPAEKEKPLDKMTATELREIAREIPGVEGVHAMKKQQLFDIIKEARGIKDEDSAEKGAKQIDVKALKEKIGRLKVEKAVALAAKDRQKVDTLRRRINRLKKRTRKAA